MKRQTKILITLLLTAALLSSLASIAFASEPSKDTASGDSSANFQNLAQDGCITDSAITDASEEEGASYGEAEKEEPLLEENVFKALYDFFMENADKIFSCLAFIGALILSFAYKKGLFPFVEKALSSLTGVVKSLREESEKGAAESNAFMEKISEKLALTENILSDAKTKISELEEKLSEAMATNDKTEEFRAVMLAEVEMIYNIFISSSLPQYQKDKVGEAYARMKQALGGKEG